MDHVLLSYSSFFWFLLLIIAGFYVLLRLFETSSTFFPLSGGLAEALNIPIADMAASVDLSWHAPVASNINNLNSVINGTGTYGFIFNSSVLPAGVPYGRLPPCLL